MKLQLENGLKMRLFKFGMAIAGTLGLAACRNANEVFYADKLPSAYVRFVNAVSDSGAQDWRFVDGVENTPTTFALPFRGIFPGATYQSLGAGSRHLRVFQAPLDFVDPNKSSPGVVSTVFFDTTFNFTAGTHYTIMAAGTLRAGSATPAKLYIFTDDFTDPGTSVAVRVINAGTGTIDVYGSPTGGTDPLPASPLAASVASFAATKWTAMAPAALALRALPTGSKTLPALIDVLAPAGVAADRPNNLTAIGGSTIAGSAFTTFFFPRSVAGSGAANFTTAGVVTAVDKYPPSGF